MRNTENDSIPTTHPIDRAHQLLSLLTEDELIDAVVYLDNVVYGNDDQPDTGDDTSEDLDDDVESIGMMGTGDEQPDAGEDSGSLEPDDPTYD
jgi:hypothetical protein